MCYILQSFGIQRIIALDGCDLPAKELEATNRGQRRDDARKKFMDLIAHRGEVPARLDAEFDGDDASTFC